MVLHSSDYPLMNPDPKNLLFLLAFCKVGKRVLKKISIGNKLLMPYFGWVKNIIVRTMVESTMTNGILGLDPGCNMFTRGKQ